MTIFLIIIAILLIHWFADFVLQTDAQAKGKSKEWRWLLAHTLTYSVVWWFVSMALIVANILPTIFMVFAPITFVAHTVTDYFTSRLNSRLWAEGRTHAFFVAVGFDQVLHYIQLFGTFFLLANLC